MPCPQNPAIAGPMIITMRTLIFARDGRSQNHGKSVRPNTMSMNLQVNRMLRMPMPDRVEHLEPRVQLVQRGVLGLVGDQRAQPGQANQLEVGDRQQHRHGEDQQVGDDRLNGQRSSIMAWRVRLRRSGLGRVRPVREHLPGPARPRPAARRPRRPEQRRLQPRQRQRSTPSARSPSVAANTCLVGPSIRTWPSPSRTIRAAWLASPRMSWVTVTMVIPVRARTGRAGAGTPAYGRRPARWSAVSTSTPGAPTRSAARARRCLLALAQLPRAVLLSSAEAEELDRLLHASTGSFGRGRNRKPTRAP